MTDEIDQARVLTDLTEVESLARTANCLMEIEHTILKLSSRPMRAVIFLAIEKDGSLYGHTSGDTEALRVLVGLFVARIERARRDAGL